MKRIGRIVSLVVEFEDESGGVEVQTMTEGQVTHLHGIDSDQHFWVATNHGSLLSGTHVIASPVPGQDIPENYKSWTETMIGLIRDGRANAFVSYNPGSLERT
jgi:hypothetical protein